VSLMQRLRRVRVILAIGIGVRAVGWGVLAALSLLLAGGIVDHFAPLPASARSLLLDVARLAGLASFVALVWRDRSVFSTDHVALWLEEQQPSLRYALVSALELRDERFLRGDEPRAWPSLASRRALRGVGLPIGVMLVALLVVLALPSGAVARLRSPRVGDVLDRGASRAPNASRLAPLVARITPPPYSGEKESTVEEPTDVRALVGSALSIEGRGAPAGVLGVVGEDTIHAAAAGERWTIPLRASVKAATVRLIDRGFQRLVAVEPIVDAPPIVTLLSPAHDSVLRQPRGTLTLSAEASDDFGLAGAAFEYIVSSGEGENFTFKSGTIGAVKPSGTRASYTASFSLATLGLKPGDILHIRAVARDANDVTGPGTGASDTRAIRIARADEYDSVAVEAAAPSEADKSIISERMLITLAEALEKRRPNLARDTLVRESRTIAADQRKLRSSVSEIIFGKADSAVNVSVDVIDIDDESDPSIAVNKPLLEAYNAMWDASTALEVGEPANALPHMRRALAAIQRARNAERLYLRGRPPQVVLDLSRVRLKGKDKGSSSTRHAVGAIDVAQRALADRFLRILDLAARNQGAAADSLLVLRIDALADNPPFAAALSDAANAIRRRRGDDATSAFVRARRALGGAPVALDSIARWGIIP
jgi:hypothetical protein